MRGTDNTLTSHLKYAPNDVSWKKKKEKRIFKNRYVRETSYDGSKSTAYIEMYV